MSGKLSMVGEAGQAGADESIGVEDGVCSGGGEEIELSVVEHLDLADVVGVGGALVGAQVEDALLLGWRRQLGPAFEGDVEGALDALKGWRNGGSAPEGRGCLHEGSVFCQQEVSGDEGFEVGGGQQQVEDRGFRAKIELECADGRDAEAIERRDESVLDVGVCELGLRAGLEMVAAELVELAGLAGGRLACAWLVRASAEAASDAVRNSRRSIAVSYPQFEVSRCARDIAAV